MANDGESSRRDDPERELREALENAECEFRQAKAEYTRLVAIRNELGNTADGLQAMRKAIMWQRFALDRYGKAVANFKNFILYGKIPK